ncbi:MAG: bifunctional homocysteine S-methyltransferase/methylenetetrahydrofolate reductase [Myxococcota bacterium]
METFREALASRILLFDGAMGTEIYKRGVFINRSYDEVNLTAPDIVQEIHSAYLTAGADVITTNSFGANRLRLMPFGLEDKHDEINASAVRLAKAAAKGNAFVAGSIGPIGAQLSPVGRIAPGEAYQAFKDQAEILETEDVDLYVLETFAHLPELWQAVRAVRSISNKPIIACLTFPPTGVEGSDLDGGFPVQAIKTMQNWKVDAIGTNCSNGPRGVLDIVERVLPHSHLPIAAMPNAGLPQAVEGRTLYLAGPEYMAEYARRLAQTGARIIGGCCGTSPDTIKEMRNFLRAIAPMGTSTSVAVDTLTTTETNDGEEPVPTAERSEFARRLLGGKFCISVELDPPRGVGAERAVNGAAMLYEAGIDVVNIADGPRAVARMGPTALSHLVQRKTPDLETVVHYCCRDRNLLGMQMDLMGAHAVGLRNILAVTGDPPKMGTYPDATAVFDIDSIGLISFIQLMNRGLDFSGKPIGGKTSLFVGAGCNPGAIDIDFEAERYGRKVEAGAEFFFSQPCFDLELLERFLDKTKAWSHIPFMVGIMPLVSARNADFLHNEVPGMQIPAPIRKAIHAAPSKEAQRKTGVEIAHKTLKSLRHHPRVQGAYIFPPFGSYKAVLKVVDGLLDDWDTPKP